MGDHLPDDLLADVLGRLAPRDLASSRGVCWSWRAVIDGRRLLRADLLPLSLGGIFLLVTSTWFPPLFSRPWTGPAPAICGDLDSFFGADGQRVLDVYFCDHCNGLLLLQDVVMNPATGEWARLPEEPPPQVPELELYYQRRLAFDPAVSPHYEVFSIPELPGSSTRWTLSPLLKQSEWPPSPLVLNVFSSRTGHWEERTFVREQGGHPMVTVADVQSHHLFYNADDHCCTFWRGRLYVQCQNGVVMRINPSSGTYHLIKQPMAIGAMSAANRNTKFYLGKSKAGVYFAALLYCQLQVWYLDESCYRQPAWVLRCDKNLEPLLQPWRSYQERNGDGPWRLLYLDEEDHGARYYYDDGDQGQLEWSSDVEDGATGSNGDDGKDDIDDSWEKRYLRGGIWTAFLGFHPFKEVIFLHLSVQRGIAYHLDSSTMQDMGTLEITRRDTTQRIFLPFPYTPCWMGMFPEND